MLVLCKILRLFVNTLTADDKYSRIKRGNLAQPIQMLLSQKERLSLNFSPHLWNLHSILNIFKKKMTLIANVFPKLPSPKKMIR